MLNDLLVSEFYCPVLFIRSLYLINPTVLTLTRKVSTVDYGWYSSADIHTQEGGSYLYCLTAATDSS